MYGTGSQNVALSALDDWMSNLAGASSIGCWMKSTDLTTTIYIHGASAAVGGLSSLLTLNRTSAVANMRTISWQLRDDPGLSLGIQSVKKVVDGKWHLCVFTKDATNTPAGMKVYIDGAQDSQTTTASGAFASPTVTGRATFLGSGGNGGSGFFRGNLAQFGVWNRELSSPEILSWYRNLVPPTGAYRYYPCEDTEMTNVLVESMATDNGTLDSVNMWSEDSPKGFRKPINK